MSKTIEEILAPKPAARPRIYAYAIADKAHAGLLKVGQTTRDVKQRVAEQLKTAKDEAITNTLSPPKPHQSDVHSTGRKGRQLVSTALQRNACQLLLVP